MQTGRKIGFSQAEEMQVWMKENAPWTDRTTNARNALFARFHPEARAIGDIEFGYDPEKTYGWDEDSLDYAVWLEIAHQGRWAIIPPTQDYWFPILKRSLSNIARLGLIKEVSGGGGYYLTDDSSLDRYRP